jgi:O-antigen/teichoic acid export membrane protein
MAAMVTDGSGGKGTRWRPGTLIQNAIALMISSGGSAIVGIVFWIVAARLFTPSELGKTTAEIAAMVLLSTFAQLSFGSIFERFLPVAGELTHGFVKRAYIISTSFGLVLATVYLALGFEQSFLPPSIGWRLLFVVAVVLWTIFALQDSVLIGLRASRWVAVENISFGVAKLALLPVCFALSASGGIFIAWTAPVIPAIVAVSWYLFRRRIPEHAAKSVPTEALPSARRLLVLASAQYATLLSSVFLPSLVTLIVIQRLGPVANAHYYLPSMISTNLGLFCWGIVRSFLVEASSDRHELRRHANSTIRALAVVLIPSVVLGYIFAPDYLRLFGDAYATQGTSLMRMLLVSLLGSTVMSFYSAFAWLDQRVWWMTLRTVASSVIYIVMVYALIGHIGINSIGVATLVYSGTTLVVFLPISIRRYRQT